MRQPVRVRDCFLDDHDTCGRRRRRPYGTLFKKRHSTDHTAV